MKDYLLTCLVFVSSWIGSFDRLHSQVQCNLNSTDTIVGAHPSDTLPDFLFPGPVTTAEVQLVLLDELVYVGNHVQFDSAVALNYLGVPLGMQIGCQNSSVACWSYPDTTTHRIRFCFTFTMGPDSVANPAYPGYDSVQVALEYYLHLPFTGLIRQPDTVAFYYRSAPVEDSLGNGLQPPATFDARLLPNPTIGRFRLEMDLAFGGPINLRFQDIYGRTMMELDFGRQAPGPHDFPIDAQALPNGVYFLTVQAGGARKTLQMIKRE